MYKLIKLAMANVMPSQIFSQNVHMSVRYGLARLSKTLNSKCLLQHTVAVAKFTSLVKVKPLNSKMTCDGTLVPL